MFETFYPYIFKTIIDAYNEDTPDEGTYNDYLRYDIADVDSSLYNDAFTVFPKTLRASTFLLICKRFL